MAKGIKTGGRKKGSLNKATADIKTLVEPYAAKAIAKLAWLMDNGDTHQVQLAAAREIVDRRFGRPGQSVALSGKVEFGVDALLQAIDGKSRGIPEGG